MQHSKFDSCPCLKSDRNPDRHPDRNPDSYPDRHPDSYPDRNPDSYYYSFIRTETKKNLLFSFIEGSSLTNMRFVIRNCSTVAIIDMFQQFQITRYDIGLCRENEPKNKCVYYPLSDILQDVLKRKSVSLLTLMFDYFQLGSMSCVIPSMMIDRFANDECKQYLSTKGYLSVKKL